MTDKASPAEPQAADTTDGDAKGEAVYMPTLQEIAVACKEIQAGWTEKERYKRLQGDRQWDPAPSGPAWR